MLFRSQGFDAIGQQQAGRLADAIEKIQQEFSPGIKKFLDEYRKDSEPLRVFMTKVGKSLIGEELPTKGSNYALVAAQDIPGKVFKSPESYKAFVDAVGGNRQIAEAEARKYFASQLEAIKTAKDAENFLRKNRTMLKETGFYNQADQYARNIAQAEKRGAAAGKVAETSADVVKKQQQLSDTLRTFESDFALAEKPAQIASVSKSFAKSLLDKGLVDQAGYRSMMGDIAKLENTIADANQFKQGVYSLIKKGLGYGVAGTAGYYGIKGVTGD